MQRRSFLPLVAYFCMEFGLDERFPIYAGGLGILAGDVLKSARELDYPMVGVGILWDEGYTYQYIGDNGWPYNVPASYSRDFVEDTGVRVNVWIRGKSVTCRVWRVTALGNAPLYLLDTGPRDSEDAWITRQLYGGVEQDRIAQEIVLGIGGVRALQALGIDVDIYHFNEGHAVFGGVELIRQRMSDGMSFDDAWHDVRTKVVFTTHTPVPAGNETHDHGILSFMGAYDTLSYWQMARIGDDPFNMTAAGLRLSHVANGVAKLHGVTSRMMWQDVRDAAPIMAITNGVHQASWQHKAIKEACDTGGDLLAAHRIAKSELLSYVREANGVSLDPDCLVIGFARRAAAYKRSNLIFNRPDVIDPLLKSGVLQLVFSGKSHPADEHGKSIVAHLYEMSKRYRDSVVFLQNYDMRIGRLMTAGCDVWLNNPQRPLEASGTSGMKAAMNGVLNLSVLDGWWPEGCIHGVNGWQIGYGYEGYGQTECDVISLYDILIGDVIPTYYDKPEKWTQMMRNSIEMAVNRFSSNRMIAEYYNLMYQPLIAVKIFRGTCDEDSLAEKTSRVVSELADACDSTSATTHALRSRRTPH